MVKLVEYLSLLQFPKTISQANLLNQRLVFCLKPALNCLFQHTPSVIKINIFDMSKNKNPHIGRFNISDGKGTKKFYS